MCFYHKPCPVRSQVCRKTCWPTQPRKRCGKWLHARGIDTRQLRRSVPVRQTRKVNAIMLRFSNDFLCLTHRGGTAPYIFWAAGTMTLLGDTQFLREVSDEICLRGSRTIFTQTTIELPPSQSSSLWWQGIRKRNRKHKPATPGLQETTKDQCQEQLHVITQHV